MSALEMLDYTNRVGEAGRFTQWQAENNPAITTADERLLKTAVTDLIYGPVTGTNLEYFRGHVAPDLALEAARVLCDTTLASSAMYAADRGDARVDLDIHKDAGFRQALLGTQQAMAKGGNFQFMPAKYGMTIDEGKQQVSFADLRFRRAPQATQKPLAEGNYTNFFGKQTMADAEDILQTTIDEAINSLAPEKMKHLTRTNYAIAQLLGSFAKNMSKDGRLVVVDCGTGSGATLGASISELTNVADHHNYQNVSIFGVEPNPSYSESLRGFAPVIMQGIQAVNPAFELVTSDTTIQDERRNTLSLVEADIMSVMETLDLSSMEPKDVAVMTANYVWHRLPSVAKIRLIGQMKSQAPNGIFLISDLERNGSSPMNRNYFNFGNNGPLNTGNLGLKGIFEFHGCRVIKSNVDQLPKSITPTLADAIAKESSNDGSFWIAYYGEEAERLVAAA